MVHSSPKKRDWGRRGGGGGLEGGGRAWDN